MAAPLAVLFDKRKRALARARFRAWWEGEAFDEGAAVAALEVANDAAPVTGEAPEDIFAEEPILLPPRLAALAALWGEGRVMPGDETAEALEPARLGLEVGGVLALIGPGLVAPVKAIAAAHPGEIAVLEWRDETRAIMAEQLKRASLANVTPAPLDLDTWSPAAAVYDGALSLDDFTYAANAPRLALQFAKALKPGACVVVEAYCAVPTPALAPAFAASFAEPQLRPSGDLAEAFTDAGLTLESNEDLSAEHAQLVRAGFARLEITITEKGLDAAALREIAWEAEAWNERLKLLQQKRLERRRLVLRKPVAA